MPTASPTSSTTEPCSPPWTGKERDLARFAAKVQFDPFTGCVIWTGATTNGRADTVRLGSFWFEGRRWVASRWAARYIHGQEIEGLEVRQTCREPLCVQHVKASLPAGNTRQFYLLETMGLNEPRPEELAQQQQGPIRMACPFFTEPEWLLPFIPEEERTKVDNDDVPF